MRMEPRLSIVTLGVADLPRSVAFYRDGLGLPMINAEGEGIAFFQLDGVRLALYPRVALAEDAALIDPGPSAFSGITLAHNLRSKAEVDAFFAELAPTGAHIVKRPRDVFWGGYSGYFTDPDGYLWEVAWNPHFAIDAPAAARRNEEGEA